MKSGELWRDMNQRLYDKCSKLEEIYLTRLYYSDFSLCPFTFGVKNAPFLWIQGGNRSYEGLFTCFRRSESSSGFYELPQGKVIKSFLQMSFLNSLTLKYSICQGVTFGGSISWTPLWEYFLARNKKILTLKINWQLVVIECLVCLFLLFFPCFVGFWSNYYINYGQVSLLSITLLRDKI